MKIVTTIEPGLPAFIIEGLSETTVRLPSLPQAQPAVQPEAVDADFTDTEEAANV